MANHQSIVEKLSQFNNMSFTKKQWELILIGCECPKSHHFWRSFRDTCLFPLNNDYKKIYIMKDLNSESFSEIWDKYCTSNRAGAKKSYDKTKAFLKARERVNSLKGHTFYIIGGVVTTEKPEID